MNQLDHSNPHTHTHRTVKEAVLRGLGKLSPYPLPVPATVRPYQELPAFLDTLETLDIILFSCPISWYSMQLQGGRWTHVGVIYRRDDKNNFLHDQLEPDNPEKVLIFESILGKEEERVSGVDLVGAKKRLSQYFDDNHPEIHKWGRGQYVAFRKLNIERTPELLEAVEREVKKYLGRPYEENMVELFRSLVHFDTPLIPIGKNRKEGPDSLFCSELVAYVYQGVGLLKTPAQGGILANEYSPCDFCSDFSVKHTLLQGALSKEVMFGFPPQTPIYPPLELPADPRKTPHRSQKHFREHFGQSRRAKHEEKKE